MKSNSIVVYMDASLYRRDVKRKSENYIGLGVYIIDSEGNDIKLGKGFLHSRIRTSNMAELASLNLFINYVKENESYFKNKRFVIYSDCEPVIGILNKENINYGALGIKKVFGTSIDFLNIEAAYWVKGHQKEKGNLITDTLAYNAMRMTLDNNDKDFETISINKHLVEIFDDVKRCPSHKMLMENNRQLNIQSYNRIHNTENNHISKLESNYYNDKLTLVEDDGIYVAKIRKDNDSFFMNDREFADFNQVANTLIGNYSILREMKIDKEVKIYIECENLNLLIKDAINEIKEVKDMRENIVAQRLADHIDFMKKNEACINLEKKIINKSDIHSGIYKLSKNKNISIIQKNSNIHKLRMR